MRMRTRLGAATMSRVPIVNKCILIVGLGDY